MVVQASNPVGRTVARMQQRLKRKGKGRRVHAEVTAALATKEGGATACMQRPCVRTYDRTYTNICPRHCESDLVTALRDAGV